MVSVIHCSKNIAHTLGYNEHKCAKGKAGTLGACGFPKDAHDMDYRERLTWFTLRTALNQATRVNTMHISLNFHPSETFADEKMLEIAKSYMHKIGFGEQPFIVYRHFDAGHPHMHIVTVNIRADGKSITMHNLVRDKSEGARKELEIEHGLVVAGRQAVSLTTSIKGDQVKKLEYGKSLTFSGITGVVSKVLQEYTFCSVEQMNAILRQYNVKACPSTALDVSKSNRGLLFYILDARGHCIGMPMRASSMQIKPTLQNLEKIFIKNQRLKQVSKQRLQTLIRWSLKQLPADLDEFCCKMKQERVKVDMQSGDRHQCKGLLYVDNDCKTVFDESELGKGYTLQDVLDACRPGMVNTAQRLGFALWLGKKQEGLAVKENNGREFAL